MPNPSVYTVGWICAIPTEHVAARAFLDEEHDLPDFVSPNDNNVYTVGRVWKHNVVIATLPDGEYGTNVAAAVARDMLHSFPNVRIGLMVGIGGGVPGKHDIRLGDVVVSAIHNGHGGIFQYDFGKTIQAQEFQNTMFLAQPPPLLRSAVGDLKARYESDGHQFHKTINSIFDKKPKLRKKYRRPDPSTDRLYVSSATHPFSSDESCAIACGQLELVPRKQREEDEDDPAIHYGLIASGNQLMKDAVFRDQLACTNDILCFEMEAAGLMNHFPCIVIRGICDYSDSHKNKGWQGYAAMTAAAYAKDILKRIPPNKIEAEQRIADSLSEMKENVARLVRSLHDQHNIAILEWLTPVDYGTQQSDYFRRRQPGTGEWLLESHQFKTWVKDENEMLFCPGMPGSGKTVLTSIVVDHLHSGFKEYPTTGIAYFYFNYKRQTDQTIDGLLASLLKQLVSYQSSLPEAVQTLYNRHHPQNKRTRPSADELIQALQSVIAVYSRVFIMIDALDECQLANDTRLEVLSSISKIRSKTRANFFITSRFDAQITETFQAIPTLEIRASEEDVSRYLCENMLHLPKFIRDNSSLQEEIITGILKAVQGMFLLAQFHIDSLKGKTKPKEVTTALQELATGSNVYEQIYTETMQRIVSQYKEQAQLATSVLAWVTFAKRLISVAELQHALAVEQGEPAFDEQNMPDIELVVSVCAGLVTIDNDSNIIRLVHYTAQEYFEQEYEKWLPEPQSQITTTCITYLSYKVFERVSEGTWPLDQTYPFYEYAALHWSDHAREGLVLHEVVGFLEDTAKINSYCNILQMSRYDSFELRRQTTGLHLATWSGLTAAIDQLLNNKFHIEATNESGETPLCVAVSRCYEAIVKLLLDKGANTEAINRTGETPLCVAVGHRYEAIVKLLLDKGANTEAINRTGETPLCDAVSWCYEAIVQLLLDKGANTKATDYKQGTPLRIAIKTGHEANAQLLLDKGVNIEATDRILGRTPLHIAANNGNKAILQLLLDNGANINTSDKYGETPLHTATRMGYKAIVHLLLDNGVNIEAKNHNSETPLHVAAEDAGDIMDLLLNKGANTEARDKDDRTPLLLAAATRKMKELDSQRC
ncbi:hypothetical protein V8C42DRAFT_327511 [Trichoderma barbatum]